MNWPKPDLDRLRRTGPGGWAVLAVILLLATSYRAYLARYHSEVGIDGLAPWWIYITEGVAALWRGEGIVNTFYAPGQTLVAFAISLVLGPEPAVLRIVFGLLDVLAVLALFFLVRETAGSWAGLAGALLYSLWPEGATASVNILHDHSPQPLILFVATWMLVRGLRGRSRATLGGAAVCFGLLPMFRADALVATLLASGCLFVTLLATGSRIRRSGLAAAAFLTLTLLPSLPYDLYLYSRSGRFTHIAAGDPWSSVFIRYGRQSGLAGTRYHDSEVAFLIGMHRPFGYHFWDPERMGLLGIHGRRLLFRDLGGYAQLVASDAWPHLVGNSGHKRWFHSDFLRIEDISLTARLGNPEWPLAVIVSESGIQEFLLSRRLLLLAAVLGSLTGFLSFRASTVQILAILTGWVLALVLLVPNPRYLLMPYCLLFPLISIPLSYPQAWLSEADGPGPAAESGDTDDGG